jgi:NADH-quinone oxidoreductase subunit J
MFYVIAAAILITAFLSVTTRRVFRSAIFLLFSLLGIAGFYFWLEVEFIAAVQISVYVGGIVVLIIFSIFLTEQAGKVTRMEPPVRTLSALIAAILGAILGFIVVSKHPYITSSTPLKFEVSHIGEAMLNTGAGGFSLPFEVVSILLLAAMIGCIVVAMRSNISDTKKDVKNLDS